ncbi:MAG: aspartate--tRNA ligase [Pseudomonadota bacterium]|jgi:aspartyl-tRNA synthetase|nr:aspartate--tRNA ligase [Syntrophaceae bacterium]MDI9556263.1 aspartate--tRNA ligase [Pseudomonadota bacterium]NLX30135.1 aspartate--tRNA ligase [Deltaproteobacteria bacterium]HNZ33742.1 aspartate--tRNA ligase [Syntrophales bacterium]HOF72840.1 aspartate--tRNA ligase [Syntrophales bacterium]
MDFTERLWCGTLRPGDAGRDVVLAGWVDTLRDHGEVLFAHLRDRSGIVQVVFSPGRSSPDLCRAAESLKSEYCLAIRGRVEKRLPGTENPGLETGAVEVFAEAMEILNASDPLPFMVSEKAAVSGEREAEAVAEDLRLKHRYLDLRRPSMQDNLFKRHRIFKCVRDYLDEQGFIEVETPMLTKSTPEGARDYLVPSRIHQGAFYALPQSPQLFKQLLMVSGFERYFQMARCFRDEDLRPNRQPEFTQLDLEASFIDEEFIYRLVEELTVRMFAAGGIDLPRPFPRMTHREAMETMGSDRPDTRFGLRFVEATDLFRDTRYGIFRQILDRGGSIKGLNIKGHSESLSKNVLQNEYAKEIVPAMGAKGMTWMRTIGGKLESNIVQFFSPAEQQAVLERFGAEDGDVLIMIADASPRLVHSVLGQLRLHLAGRLGLIPQGTFAPLWVTDFPLFEATDGGVTSSHHPFTSPDRPDFDPDDREGLLNLKSRAYDLVVNGEELGGGSIRIHDRGLQSKIFRALGLSSEAAEEKFGFFLRALDYGTPPHGGLALGMDRVVSMILGVSSIREVIAFPKNRSAQCPLTQAPSEVSREQLGELGLLDRGGDRALPGTAKKEDLLEYLSWVSRIGVSEAERPALEKALAEASRLADAVEGVETDAAPAFSAVPVENRIRAGGEPVVSRHSESRALFANAPAMKGRYFKVAGILE